MNSGRIATFERLVQQNYTDPKFAVRVGKDETNKIHGLIFLAVFTLIFLHELTKPWLERHFSEVPLESNILFLPTQSGDVVYNAVKSDEPIIVGDTVAIRINQRPLTGGDVKTNLEMFGFINPPVVDAYATKVVALEGDTVSVDGMKLIIPPGYAWVEVPFHFERSKYGLFSCWSDIVYKMFENASGITQTAKDFYENNGIVDRGTMQFTSATLYGRLVRTSSDFGPVPLEILHKIIDVEQENPLWTKLPFIFGKDTDEYDIKAGLQHRRP